MTIYVAVGADQYIAEYSTNMFEGSTDVTLPDDFDEQYAAAYQLKSGKLVLDPVRKEEMVAQQLEYYRNRPPDTETLMRAALPLLRKQAMETYSDDQLDEAKALFPIWSPNTAYSQGEIVLRDGKLYRAQQAHTSQAHQPPDAAGMLAVYAPVQAPAPEGQVLPWVYGETGLKAGDRRTYNGVVYEAIQAPNANIHTPNIVPAIWKAV